MEERDHAVGALAMQIQSMVEDQKLPRIDGRVDERRMQPADEIKFKKSTDELVDEDDTDDYIDQLVAGMCLLNRLRQLEGRRPMRLLVCGRAPKNDETLSLARAKKVLGELRSKYELSGTDERTGANLMTGAVAPSAVLRCVGASMEEPARRPSISNLLKSRDDNAVWLQVLVDDEPWPDGADA